MSCVSSESAFRLIGRIYDAAHHREPLTPVIADLASLFSGSRACLLRMGTDEGRFQAIASVENDIEDFIRLGPTTLQSDPLLRAMRSLPVGVVASRDRMIDEAAFRRSDVWQGFFRAREMDIGLTCKLRATGDTHWFVDLQRSRKQGPLLGAELRLFTEITSHLGRAAAISELLEDALAASEIMSPLAPGCFVVDADCRVLRMNDRAGTLLERHGTALCLAGRKLTAPHPGHGTALQQLVRACCTATGALPRAGGAMHLVSEDEGEQMRLVLSVSPYLNQRSFDLEPTCNVIILVYAVSPQRSVDFEQQLRHLFGLTIAEAKIAASLTAGLTLKQAAETSEIRITTARWYLREVLYKTKTNRQAQLVALLVNLQALRLS